jgi:hypothetical protein
LRFIPAISPTASKNYLLFTMLVVPKVTFDNKLNSLASSYVAPPKMKTMVLAGGCIGILFVVVE